MAPSILHCPANTAASPHGQALMQDFRAHTLNQADLPSTLEAFEDGARIPGLKQPGMAPAGHTLHPSTKCSTRKELW